MHFTKMHGLGNDYLYVYGEAPENVSELSQKLSNRHFGAGSDGMIFISKSNVADYKMRIFNADGSEAKMCGNGIRCVGKYLYDKGYVEKCDISIETLSGIKSLHLHVDNNCVCGVSVEMGAARVEKKVDLKIDGGDITVIPVSVGNPHAVIFVNDMENAPLTTVGPKVEKHTFFPDGVNVEFVQVISKNELRMRVWERGSAVTLACGTGACASVAASIASGFFRYNQDVTVILDGGILVIKVLPDNTVIMTGPAEFIYEGDTEIA